MTEIKGICPIIATPFTPTGAVDFDSMRSLLHWMIAQGSDALTLFGIAGEYYKLSDDERKQMIAVVVDECRRGGAPAIISITAHAAEMAVQEARYAEQAGADCLMVLPPFFLKPSGGDAYNHILAVARAVALPIMVQYAPEQTGVGIEPALLARLSQESTNLVYFKIESRPPGAYITRLLALTDRKVGVFAGNAGFQMIENFDRGAIGVMPGCSMTDVYVKCYRRYFAGDRQGAIQTHNALLPMLNHIRQNVEQIIFYEKRILKKRGVIASDTCRQPTFAPDAFYDALFELYYEQFSEQFE
jgi:4-hydroxy-tetrahydrodipicolinate synthase